MLLRKSMHGMSGANRKLRFSEGADLLRRQSELGITFPADATKDATETRLNSHYCAGKHQNANTGNKGERAS